MASMRSWARPYEAYYGDQFGLRYLVAAGMSVGACVAMLGGIVAGGVPLASAPFIVLFWAVWTTMLWRLVLVGVYVNDYGVKVRFVHRTHVIAWPDVTRAWAGQAAHYDAWQIWITTRDPERDVETPIWRRGPRRRSNRVILEPEEFATVLTVLNAHRRPDTP